MKQQQQQKQQKQQNPKKKKMKRDHHPQNKEEERLNDCYQNDNPSNDKQRMLQDLVNEVEDEEQAAKVGDETAITTTARRRTATTASTPSVDQTSQIVDEIAELCESILEAPQQAFSATTTGTSSSGTAMMDGSEYANSSNKKKFKQQSSRDTATSSSISKMDQLLHYASSSTVSMSSSSSSTNIKKDHSLLYYDQDYIAQLAIMSLLVIYKDIVPSYRIRLPTAQEMAIKVSKEIQVLWDYERTLLRHYQQYITLLQSIWDTHNKSVRKGNISNNVNINPKQSSLANTCILTMAELLKTTFHFNFRSNLLSAVIRQMNYKSGGGESPSTSYNELHDLTTEDASRNSTIRTACCDAIQYIFMNDHQGDVTLEAARQISKYMKDRNYKNIHVQMLQTFYYIPLRVHVDEIMAVKIQQSINKKKRKRSDGNRELSMIENEIKEGSTTVDKVLLAQYQSDTLQVVILTYFRILKCIPAISTAMDGSASSSSTIAKMSTTQKHIHELLPTCLEGLAKFAHLINIDTVIDLLSVLRDLLQQQRQHTTTYETTIPVDATLNCILTAFQTLQGPGKEMKIDMKDYIVPLYNQIYRIVNFNESSSVKDGINEMQSTNQKRKKGIVELLLQCLTMAFIQRREFSNVRLAAFTKQLLTVSLHCTRSDMTIPLLAFVRQLIHRYPASVLQQLFDNEQDVITQGQYRMDVSDPEHANPYATSAWECTLLQFHYNTKVQNQAMNVATCKMLQLPSEEPLKLHIIERKQINELYLRFVRQQKRHPLLIPSKNEKNNNNRRVRFVTPRVKHCNLQNLRL